MVRAHSLSGYLNNLVPASVFSRSVFSFLTLSLSISSLLVLASCGGSSSSTPPPPPPTSYTLTAAALNPGSVTAGGTTTSAITVTPVNSYSGSVTLSCGKLMGSAPPTCSFSANPVTISGSTPGSSTLTVSTTNNTPGGSYTVSVTGSDANSVAPSDGAQSLTLVNTAVIQHIVVIFQENRTPDNLFHDQTLITNGADISFTGNDFGQQITLSPVDLGTTGSTPQNYDLSHANTAFVQMYDGGKMDGASQIHCSPATGVTCPSTPQFKYVKPADVAPYFAMAEQYTFGDRMFQTNEGPSFPAHQFILGGTSAPTATSTLFASENPALSPAGCIAASTNTVTMINANGSETASPAEYPCFDHPTLTDRLDAKGVSWRYYAPSAGSIWTAPDAIDHICQPQTINNTLTCTGPDWTNNVVIPEWGVLEDIANGQLAQVSWVIPDGAHSDHALSNDGSGPSWVASVVNAIGNSQYWNNTAIIITWDDWGGWYDHVAPKVINDGVSWGSGYVYGFRVPLIIVSPYANAAYISHATHDFGSILKLVENTFDLPSLGYADVAADDFSDCFNLAQTPITFQTIAAPLDANYFINNKNPPVDPDDD